MGKALVIGRPDFLEHDLIVRTCFLSSAPSGWTCDIVMVGSGVPEGHVVAYLFSLADCVRYAIDNGYKIIVRAYSSAYACKLEFGVAIDAGVAVVHAHGSNEHILLTDSPHLFEVILVGGGTAANARSYGPGLELYDALWDGQSEESWATPTAAGRLARIFDNHPEYNVFDARQALRQASSLYPAWVADGGFGRASNNFPAQLQLAPPLEIAAVKALNNRSVHFTWNPFAQTLYNRVRIAKASGEVLYSGTGTEYTWVSDLAGSQEFIISQVDADGNLSSEQTFTRITITGLDVFVPLGTVGVLDARTAGSLAALTLEAVVAADAYSIDKNIGAGWTQVQVQQALTFLDTLVVGESAQYRYRAWQGEIATAYSNVVTLAIDLSQPVRKYKSKRRLYKFTSRPQ